MPIIALLNPKGGVGKTTITLNLGLFLSAQNKNVVFIDCDPQASLFDWLKRRPSSLSPQYCLKKSCQNLSKENVLASAQKFSDDFNNEEDIYYLLDCPAGMNNTQIADVVNLSDVLLIPTSPSPVDLRALSHFFFQLAGNEKQPIDNKSIALIANRVKIYTKIHAETIKKIESFKIPLISTIRDTQNYILPATKGMGLVDLPLRIAKADIKNWDKILTWLEQVL